MTDQIHNPALQWAEDRAMLPYDRFVDGQTSATIRRIQAAHMNRFIHSDLRTAGSADPPQKPRASVLIRDAFRERIGTLHGDQTGGLC